MSNSSAMGMALSCVTCDEIERADGPSRPCSSIPGRDRPARRHVEHVQSRHHLRTSQRLYAHNPKTSSALESSVLNLQSTPAKGVPHRTSHLYATFLFPLHAITRRDFRKPNPLRFSMAA